MNRRNFAIGAMGAVALAAGGAALSYRSMGTMKDHDDAAARNRAALAANPDFRELIRYATLAANSHNTQPWTFAVADSAITLRPDFRRRTPVVDPDDHHLFVSLGCAAENLAQAAAASGWAAEIAFDAAGEGKVDVNFTTAPPIASDLFKAIPQRQCTRSVYDGQPIPVDEMKLLEKAASQDGILMKVVTGKPEIESLLELVLAANRSQMADPAFVAELKAWLRFNPATALQTSDGLFSACSGNPILPAWLGRPLFSAFFTEFAETDKIVKQVRSSAGFAIFASESDDKRHWFNAGRAYQRFALQAAALGIRNAHLNQPVEVADLRPAFARSMNLGGSRPDLVIRFGRAPLMPMSLRRPLASVIV